MNSPHPVWRLYSRRTITTCVLVVLLMTIVPTGAGIHAQSVESQPFPNPPAMSSTTASSNNTHTLSITAKTPGRYAVIATKDVGLTDNTKEAEDSVRQQEIQGSIGTENPDGVDRQDTIVFTGYIVGFQATHNVSVNLDGQSVAPAALNGSHIRFTNLRESKKGAYEFTVDGTISPTRSVESEDSVINSSATGTLAKNGETDSFYYSGEIESSEFSGSGRVFINGQQVSTDQTNTSSDPMATSTPINIGNTPFTISNLQMSNSNAVVGEPVVISVRVQNDHPNRVSAPVRLGAEGTVVRSRDVALFADDWQSISFTHTFDSPGNYTIKVGTLEQTIRVRDSGQSGGIGGFALSQLALTLVGSIAMALGGVRFLRWMN